MKKTNQKQNGFAEKLQRLAELEKKRQESKKKKEELEKRNLEEARKSCLKWKDSFQPRFGESAGVIMRWFHCFVKSDDFKKLEEMGELKLKGDSWRWLKIYPVRISRVIKYTRPCWWNRKIVNFAQFLFIDIKEKALYVHEEIKYGDSYRIDDEIELMRYVDPPVALEIAETIEKFKIEGIILNNLREDEEEDEDEDED